MADAEHWYRVLVSAYKLGGHLQHYLKVLSSLEGYIVLHYSAL